MPIRRKASVAPPPEDPSFLDRIGGLPGLAAGGVRAITGVASAPGFGFGAVVSGLGELGAEALEGSLFEQDLARTAARVGAAGAIGAVPFGAVLKAGRPLASAVRGATYSGGGEALREAAAGQEIDPGAVAGSAATGGVLTGGISALMKLFKGGRLPGEAKAPPVAKAPLGPKTAKETTQEAIAQRVGKFSERDKRAIERLQDQFETSLSTKIVKREAEQAAREQAYDKESMKNVQKFLAERKRAAEAAQRVAANEERLTKIEEAITKGNLTESKTPAIAKSLSATTAEGERLGMRTPFKRPKKGGEGAGPEDVETTPGGAPSAPVGPSTPPPSIASIFNVPKQQPPSAAPAPLATAEPPVTGAGLVSVERIEPRNVRQIIAQLPRTGDMEFDNLVSQLQGYEGKLKLRGGFTDAELDEWSRLAGAVRKHPSMPAAIEAEWKARGAITAREGPKFKVGDTVRIKPPVPEPNRAFSVVPPVAAPAVPSTPNVPAVPRAVPAFDWPGVGKMYTIVGGPSDRSTVTAAKLLELGIPVPEEAAAPAASPLSRLLRGADEPIPQSLAADIDRLAAEDAIVRAQGGPYDIGHNPQWGKGPQRRFPGEPPVETKELFPPRVPRTPSGPIGAPYKTETTAVPRAAKAAEAVLVGPEPAPFNPALPGQIDELSNLLKVQPQTPPVAPAAAQPAAAAVPVGVPPITDPVKIIKQLRNNGYTQEQIAAMSADDVQAALNRMAPAPSPAPGGPRIVKKGPRGSETGEVTPLLLARLGLGAGGALIGAATDPLDNPLLSAVAGGAAGAMLPSIVPMLQRLGAPPEALQGLDQAVTSPEGIKEATKRIYHSLPQIQRFNYLANIHGLTANVLFGPYGSAAMGAIEKGLSGDPRGWVLLKSLSPRAFIKEVHASMPEAARLIEAGELGRAEAVRVSAGAPYMKRFIAQPAQLMTSGDLAARKYIVAAGFSEAEARAMTLTSEPEFRISKAVTNVARSGPLGSLLLPFSRTPANIAEQGAMRLPLIGSMIQSQRGAAADPLRTQLVQQYILSPAVAATSGAIASQLDPETAKIVRRYVTNIGGRYSLQSALGFAAGQAIAQGKPAISTQNLRPALEALPLPTADPFVDWSNFILSPKHPLPPGAVPSAATQRVLPSMPAFLEKPRPTNLRRLQGAPRGIRRRQQ